jgi:hypothetical protein
VSVHHHQLEFASVKPNDIKKKVEKPSLSGAQINLADDKPF